jgi:type II secretory pathway pseudopilin PulG
MRRRVRLRRGFTLIEAALTTLIVGTGILSMMMLFANCTQQNATATQMTTAMLLASHIQEAMAALPFNDPVFGSSNFGPEPGETLQTYNDVDDFDGSRFNPPIDATRQSIPDAAQYTQVVSVVPVYSNQLSSNTNESSPSITKSTYTGAVRVRVKILYQRIPGMPVTEVYRTSWIRVDR